MFSPALTAAPTVGTVAYASLTFFVPVAVICQDFNAGVTALMPVVVLAVSAVANNALAGMANPLYIGAGAFALGFVVGCINNESKGKRILLGLLEGTTWAVFLTTPAANVILNGVGTLTARTVSHIASSMAKV